ncbi:metalloregulator ArsR/SmtB family transcription factor [Puia sp.]|uniref:ArsR/SmtB family transcription factor n=1 Tax=Puia sp. TaxID=2045100 RepID=UPI002F423764
MNPKLDTKRLERMCKALGDPYRIKMLEYIRQNPDWTQCTAITESFNLAQSTVSHHLKQLVEVDLLHSEKEGRCTKYKINEEAFSDYVDYLKCFQQ